MALACGMLSSSAVRMSVIEDAEVEKLAVPENVPLMRSPEILAFTFSALQP